MPRPAGTISSRRVARRSLDRRLNTLRDFAQQATPPRGGWLRAIRQALGMSTTDLAARLGVNQTTAARIEANERSGRVQLDTLARAADALGCDLVYALIPREPLETSVDNRAREVAVKQVSAVDHSMALEDQRVSASAAHDQLHDQIERLRDRPGLWHDE